MATATTPIHEQVTQRYELLDPWPIGKGSYGVVWRAVDRETKQVVALKKCSEAFRDEKDDPWPGLVAQRTYREIEILRRVKHDNVVNLLAFHVVDTDVYLVFEFLAADLAAAIRRGSIPDADKPFVVYELLKALKYLHSAGIAHRDLKPANVLVDIGARTVKVADLGLARSVAAQGPDAMLTTRTVGTYEYSAPEVLGGATDYTSAADMWAVGCILGELYTRRPLFFATTLDVIHLRITPRPTGADAAFPGDAPVLHEVRPRAPAEALDLLRRLLQMKPDGRPTAEQALAHPYFAHVRDAANEPAAPSVITPALPDATRFSVQQYHRLVRVRAAVAAADESAARRDAAAVAHRGR